MALNSSLLGRASAPAWTGYATALGGLAAFGSTAPAHAAITTATFNLTYSTVNQFIDIDLNPAGGTPVAVLNTNLAGADFQLRSTGVPDVTTAINFNGSQIAGYYPIKLSAGAVIDSTLAWHSGPNDFEFYDSDSGTGWQGGAQGYIGLRVSAGGGNWNYGWALINDNDVANTMTLISVGYQTTPNTPILAAAVPEPSSLVLGVLGLGGLAMHRRRRRALAAS